MSLKGQSTNLKHCLSARSLKTLLACAILSQTILLQCSPSEAARKYVPTQAEPAVKSADKPKPVEADEPIPAPPRIVVKTVTVPVQARRKPKDPFTNLMDDHRFYEALRVVEKRIQDDPGSIYWQLSRAQILRLDGEYQLSEEAYQNLFPKVKTKYYLSQAYYGFGMLRFSQAEQFRRLGDEVTRNALLDEAASIFQQSIAVRPSVDAYAGWANIALLQNRLEDCAQALTKGHALSPNNLSIQLTQGYLALAQNNSTLASQVAYRIRRQAPDDPRALMLLGRSAMVETRYDDAIIFFRQLSERLPENTEALHWLSRAYEKKDRLEDAETVLEKAVFINPFDWDAVQSLMTLFERSGDPQRSVLLTRTILAQVASREQKENQTYPLYRMMLEEALTTRLNQTGQWQESYPVIRKIAETCYQTLTPSEVPIADSASNIPVDVPQQSLAAYCQVQHINQLKLLAEASYFTGDSVVYWSRFYDDLLIKQAMVDLHHAVREHPNDTSVRLAMLFVDPLASLPARTVNPVLEPQSDVQEHALRLQEAFLTGNRVAYGTLMQYVSTAGSATPSVLMALAERLYDLGDMQGARILVNRLPSSSTLIGQDDVKEFLRKVDMQEQDIPNRIKTLRTLPKDEASQFWVRMATAAIRTAPYNLKLRGMVADSLMQQDDYTSASVQLRIAAQYAPSERERSSLLRRAERLQNKK